MKYNQVFYSPFIEIFLEKKVFDMKNKHKNKIDEKEDICDIYFERLKNSNNHIIQSIALFQTMYQIRCNLFHGSKSPDRERDLELVRCSGEILEIYLQDLN